MRQWFESQPVIFGNDQGIIGESTQREGGVVLQGDGWMTDTFVASYVARDVCAASWVWTRASRAGIISCCSRSFVGPGGLLRMTVPANVRRIHFTSGYCRPCHSERSEESPVFSIRRGAEAFTRPFARTQRRHRCGQTGMSAPPSRVFPEQDSGKSSANEEGCARRSGGCAAYQLKTRAGRDRMILCCR